MENEKKKWEKPELVIIARGELGENVLTNCGIQPDGSYYLRSGAN